MEILTDGAPPIFASSMTRTRRLVGTVLSACMITGISSFWFNRLTIERTPAGPISRPPYITFPVSVIAIRMLFFSKSTADDACGFVTSTPVSSTNTVVTIKTVSYTHLTLPTNACV